MYYIYGNRPVEEEEGAEVEEKTERRERPAEEEERPLEEDNPGVFFFKYQNAAALLRICSWFS